MSNIIQAFPKGNGTDMSIIAEEFDDTKDYKVGDKVIKDKKYYVFTSDHDAGAWDSSDVDETNVSEEIPIGLTDEDMDEIKAQFHPVRIGNVTPMQIYSPVEHQVGWWQEEIDGVLKQKPVYEKTIFNITPTISEQIVATNIDRHIGYSFKRNYANNNNYFIFYDGIADTNNICFRMIDNSLSIEVASSKYNAGSGTLVVRYTKTTDEWEEV